MGDCNNLDLSVGRDKTPVQLVVAIVVPEHGREDLVPDPGVRVATRGIGVPHGDVVAPTRLFQVGDVHVVRVAVRADHKSFYWLERYSGGE